MLRSICLISFLFLLAVHASAQLVFTQLPSNMQLFARDKNNTGHFTVSGTCKGAKTEAVRLILKGEKQAAALVDQVITLGSDSSFSANFSIPAVLEHYELRIYSIRQTQEILEKRVTQLVAGDFFIVTGQSNAAGAMGADVRGYREDSAHANKYCRTIGTMFQYAVASTTAGIPNFSVEQDCKFARASSIYTGRDSIGCVGIWPIHILGKLVKETGIPVCVINGAIGSTFLRYHLASHTPSDPANLRADVINYKDTTPSPYDRIFKKLFVNNATAGVKAVFWYQGENDATLSKEEAGNYNKRFALLRASWKADYPNLEKIFVCQINTGCGGSYVGLVRDQQRKLAEEFDDVVVMPTVGSRQEDRADDLCHYSVEGYGKIGDNLASAVLNCLYHAAMDEQAILGPAIKRAYYTKVDEICLEFDKPVSVQQTASLKEGTAVITDYFYKEGGEHIPLKAVNAEEQRVYLQLENNRSFVNRITYLPDIFSNIPGLYKGPWILNRKNENLGALSFYEFPVDPLSDELLIYPNPAADHVVITTGHNLIYTLWLFSSTGEKLLELQNLNLAQAAINTQKLENGLYILKASTSTGTIIRKLVVKNVH